MSRRPAWLVKLARLQWAAASIAVVAAVAPVRATIYGTLSNFDTFNETPEPSEGAQIELEGVHSASIYSTFPAHYEIKDISEYTSGALFGTRITFQDYHFVDSTGGIHTSINPNLSPPNTNGHFAVNIPDAEHFGFSVTAQPTATRFFWLNRNDDGQYTRINIDPVAIPNPTWTFVPPNGGGRPIVEAQAELPEVEHHVRQADAVWVKVYKTELPRNVKLDELMSGPGSVAPQEAAEIESEWELLDGSRPIIHSGKLDDANNKSVVRRYEFFKYTGAYSAEHEPISTWDAAGEPPAAELGPFVAANMVAANLDPVVLPGDSSGDGLVNGQDINPFVRALLSGRNDFEREYRHGVYAQADVNGDGLINGQDINPFVDLLTGAGVAPAEINAMVAAVPEPAALAGAVPVVLAAACRRPRSRRDRGPHPRPHARGGR